MPGLQAIKLWDGTPAWLVTRHADVKAVLGSPAVCSDNTLPGYPNMVPHRKRASGNGQIAQPLLTDLDGEPHLRLRRLVAAEFTVKRVRRLRGELAVLVDECLNRLEEAGPGADVNELVLREIPSQVICTILGFPDGERDRWRDLFIAWTEPSTSEEVRLAARQEMTDYTETRVRVSEADRGDDFISRLLDARDRGNVSDPELRMLAFLLFAAGFDTTANSMAFGLIELLRDPAQAERLRSGEVPVDRAVEELLRVTTIIHFGITRIATAPLIIGGQEIAPGEGIVLSLLGANYDDEEFLDAARLDLGRSEGDQIGFGFGMHACIGQQLARVELTEFFPRILGRFPTMRLAVPAEELTFRATGTRVVTAVPVTW